MNDASARVFYCARVGRAQAPVSPRTLAHCPSSGAVAVTFAMDETLSYALRRLGPTENPFFPEPSLTPNIIALMKVLVNTPNKVS